MLKKQTGKRTIAGLMSACLGVAIAGCGGGSGGSVGGGAGQSNILLGITAANTLIRFDPTAPATVVGPQTIVGLQAGETLLAIDYRPTSNRVYALGSSNRLYLLDLIGSPITATAVGGQLAVPLVGTSFGVDFDPVTDVIRIVSDTNLNLRVNPVSGTIIDSDLVTPGLQLDDNLAYAAGDAGFGIDPNIVALAYSNNDTNGATPTTAFGIDSNLNTLVTLGTRENIAPPVSPNTGQLFTVGALGADVTNVVSFDITGNNTAYAVFAVAGVANPQLYRISLATGSATALGTVGGGQQVVGLTFLP